MVIKKTGKVIKGLGGLYSILVGKGDSKECVSCRAKGALHKDENKLLIGDEVTVTYDTELPDSVVISEILTRKNALIRPPLANLDLLFITIAAKKPTPALDVVDKLIAISIHNNIYAFLSSLPPCLDSPTPWDFGAASPPSFLRSFLDKRGLVSYNFIIYQ